MVAEGAKGFVPGVVARTGEGVEPMMKSTTNVMIDRGLRAVKAAISIPMADTRACQRPAKRRVARIPELEPILSLAYDTQRRTYVVIDGRQESRRMRDIDESTALSITDQLELAAKRNGLRRAPLAMDDRGLQPKELLVLQAAADGLTNRAIASRLRITENTVKRHNQHIYAKLGVQSRTQAVLLGLERGLISRDRAVP